MYFSLDAAHTSGGHGWPASTTLLKKNSESQPWTLDGRAPPADITTHRLRIAPSMAFFKRISGGRGRLRLPRALPPLPLRQDAYSTTASPEAASEGSSRRGDFTLFFEPMRARRQPDRGPTQKSRRRHARDAGPNAPETRGRPRRTRRGKSWTRRRPRPAAARGRQGAHGRAGHREGARHECGLRPPRSHHGRAGFTG